MVDGQDFFADNKRLKKSRIWRSTRMSGTFACLEIELTKEVAEETLGATPAIARSTTG